MRPDLDTNIVLSALLFNNGRLAWIRRSWQEKQIQPLVCKETVNELLRVLAYPKFKLTTEDRQTLLADFLPHADVVKLPKSWPDLPVRRDEKDQVFLVLAKVGKAKALVTGDADLLVMRDDFPGLIQTADELARILETLAQREAAQRLANLGGSQPGIQAAPRRRQGVK